MRKLVEKIIQKLKKENTYKLDPNYSSKQLLYISYYRFKQILRGTIRKVRISSSGLIFCGKNVTVEHAYLIKAGSSLILENNVQINALSINGIVLGNHVTIANSSTLICTGVIANKGVGIKIGNNSAIGAQSFLGGQGGIEIGDDVIMGPQVKIFSENHNYNDPLKVIRKQGETRKGVKIGNNCWIGAGVVILDGVTLRNGCVVAAGAIVTSSFPENSILAGIPAKIIKLRI
jgi:acetyltransferase-like isoleucine patch superfamily enzyme